MKRAYFWASLIAVVILFFFESGLLIRSDVPPLSITTTDLGSVYNPEIKSFKVVVRNTSFRTLDIDRIIPTCGCTTVLIKKLTIKGYASSSLPFIYNSTGKMGPQQVGFYLFGNRYSKPIRLKTSVRILPVVPDSITLPPTRADRIVPTTTLLYHRNSGRPLIARIVSYDSRFIQATLRPLKSGDIELNTQSRPSAIGKEFGAELHIQTNDPLKPDAFVVVHGKVFPFIALDPEEVSLGVIHAHEHPVTTVNLWSPYERNFRITNAFCSCKTVHVTEIERNSSNLHKIVIKVSGQAPTGAINDQILVHTDDPQQPLITIPIYGIAQN